MERWYVVFVGLGFTTLGCLSLWVLQMGASVDELESRAGALETELGYMLANQSELNAELESLRRVQDTLWMPEPEDLVIAGTPEAELVLWEDPYYIPNQSEWRWRKISFELKNNYEEDLEILIELELECDDDNCLSVSQVYNRGNWDWTRGWQQILGIRGPISEQRNVVKVPSKGSSMVSLTLGKIRTPSSDTPPQARYRITGISRLEYGHLYYTVRWDLGAGDLKQITTRVS